MYLYDSLIHTRLLHQTAHCMSWDQVCVDHRIVGPLYGFAEVAAASVPWRRVGRD